MMRRRPFVFAAGVLTATLAAGALAYALDCAFPIGQHADLELVSVTVDGTPQQDLSRYQGLRVTVRADVSGGATAVSRGVRFIALRPDNQYFQEVLGAPVTRDR